MEKKIKENANRIQIEGFALFPKYDKETGKNEITVTLDKKDLISILKKVKEIGDELEIHIAEVEWHEENLAAISTKSIYEIPIYKPDGSKCNNVSEVFWGAHVQAIITLKEYEYKKKKGVTSYLNAIKIIKQGTDYSIGMDDFV